MRHWMTGLCVAAAVALVGCSSAFEPPESTARAIDSDIAAAHDNGPTSVQVGQASVTPDVLEPHSNSVVPAVTIPINNAY